MRRGETPVAHLFHSAHFSSLAPPPILTPMAPIRRFSAEEKGKAPRYVPEPLLPKKRPVHRRGEVVMLEMTRPWCERPPHGYPLTQYAQAEGSGERDDERHRSRRSHGQRAVVTRVVAPGVHAADSSHELVLWAVMPPSTWIRFPSFFSTEMPPRGPLELWLQHADCGAPATGAEVDVVSPGKVFMT